MYKLYVIPGSHACRSAMLMLEHKRVEYRPIDFITLTHPLMARLHGFDSGRQTRTAGRHRTLGLRLGDRLGTVPALAAGRERISTNHRIARFLDRHHPEPALIPDDPTRRAAVEEAEAWANQTLQMAARRVLGVAYMRDPGAMSRRSGSGRLGHLLYRRRVARRFIVPRILRNVFAAGLEAEDEVLGGLPQLLDRVDGWIEEGTLNGAELNAADCMVAPSLALILYNPAAGPLMQGRPAMELVDRLLPAPGARPG